MSGDQLRRLKELEKENERLRRAVSDLMLDKQILAEAAQGVVKRQRLTPQSRAYSMGYRADQRHSTVPNNRSFFTTTYGV